MKNTHSSELLRALELTKKLMAFHTTAENKEALSNALELVKNELKEFQIEAFENNGVKSLLAHNAKPGTKHFKVIFNAHIDVVHAHKNQFQAVEKDGKLYGRGSYDMKAATAIMIEVFKKVANKLPYSVALQIVTDEELGGFDGTAYQIKQGIRADFVIGGDCASNFNIINQSKGVAFVCLRASGVKSHGAYPWRGENALWKIHKALAALHKKFPVPDQEVWESTMNLSQIETHNPVKNRVPDQASAFLDFRFIPEDEHTIMEKIIQIVSPHVEVEVKFKDNPENTSSTDQYVTLLKKTAENIIKKPVGFIATHGSSDIRHFKKVDCAGVEFGPIGNHQHADDESVDIQSLQDYYHVLKQFLLSLK